MSTGEIILNVGAVPIRVTCASAPLLDAIRERFGRFTADTAPALHIDILTTSDRDTLEPLVSRKIGDRVYAFAFDGVDVVFDVPGGVARVTHCPDVTAFTFLYRCVLALYLAREGGFIFHGAGILRGGKTILFTGPSESGKTTVARASGDTILSDECVVVRRSGLPEAPALYTLHGTPFWGEMHGADSDESGPLAACFFLRKDSRNAVRPLQSFQIVARMLENIFCPVTFNDITEAVLGECLRLTQSVPAAELRFSLPVSFWSQVDAFIESNLRMA